jgi:hypothetical protein
MPCCRQAAAAATFTFVFIVDVIAVIGAFSSLLQPLLLVDC